MKKGKVVLMSLMVIGLWFQATWTGISREIQNPNVLKSFGSKSDKHVTEQQYMKTHTKKHPDLQNPEYWSKIEMGGKPVLKQSEKWDTDEQVSKREVKSNLKRSNFNSSIFFNF